MTNSLLIQELDQMIAMQEEKLLEVGRIKIKSLTKEDLLQPFDFPELENFPLFRYEEGILHGMLSAKALFLSLRY
jgi:hypothetical protein